MDNTITGAQTFRMVDKLYVVIDTIAAGDIDGDSMIDLARSVFKNKTRSVKK